MKRIRMMFFSGFATIVLGMALISSPAFAVTYFPPLTGFQDDDLDFFFDSNGDGLISPGDRLAGVVEFEQTQSLSPSGSAATILPQELTGVFDLRVVSVVGNVITFTATGAGGLLATQPAGTAVSLYLDSSPDLDLVAVNCTSLADCVAKASDSDTGLVYLNAGFGGDADESWTAVVLPGGLSPATVAGTPGTTTIGFFNYFLSILTNNTGQTFGLQSCSPVCQGGDGFITLLGSGNILGGAGLINGAFARSDGDFQVATRVPEPSTLLLLGAGLVGVSFIARRRVKK